MLPKQYMQIGGTMDFLFNIESYSFSRLHYRYRTNLNDYIDSDLLANQT